MEKVCCKSCGSVDLHEEVNVPGHMHYGKLVCDDCGVMVKWTKKPENMNKRYDENEKWKKRHRDHNGQFKCLWCGVDEKIFSDHIGWKFQCDHIIPLSEGGPDAFENTQILCFVCHGDKTNRRKQVLEIMKKYVEVSHVGNDERVQPTDNSLPWS